MEVCDPCAMLSRIEELEEKMKKNHESHKDLYNKVNESQLKRTIVETKIDEITRTLKEIKDDIAELKQKPTKQWDTFIAALITAIAGALVGYFFGG